MSPDTPRRLILHIGQHKTGSTAIQHALARGEIRPARRSLLYTAPEHHNYLPRHFDAWADDGTLLPGTAIEPGLDVLSARLAQGDFDDTIFSAENFEGMDADRIRRVLEHFFLPHVQDHRILCWVRPHAARTVSEFAENIKIGWFDGDLEAYHERFLRDRVLDYSGRLQDLQDRFGDRFHPRPMLRELLAEHSILHDFAEAAFGTGANVAIATDQTANESLPLEDLVMLRHLQGKIADRNMHLRHAFGWEMMHILQSHPRRGTRLTLHRGLAERIRSDYLEDARTLDRGIFAATPVFERELDRAVAEAIPEAQSLDPRDHFDPARLRDLEVMADLLLTLIGNRQRPWQPYLVDRRVKRLHGHAATPQVVGETGKPAHSPARTEPARAVGNGTAGTSPGATDRLLTFHDVPVLPNRATYHNGVLGDGGPVWPEPRPELRHYRHGQPADKATGPSPDQMAELMRRAEVLAEPCLWGGYAHHHFGHLIVDHMTRIVTARAERPTDRVLFTLPPGKAPASLPGWFWDVAGWYGLTRSDIRFVTAPLLARELRVAPQAEHQQGGPPDPSYLALLDALPSARALVPRSADLLYVTRAGLVARGKGGHAGEAYLVSLLTEAGVTVLDPGAAPLRDQLTLYAGARHIVFAEGSAMHGRQLLGYRPQRITVLLRLPGTRTAKDALTLRVEKLEYAKVVRYKVAPDRAGGGAGPHRAISFYDLPVLFDTFARLGIDLRRHWDDAAYRAARDADIRAWLAGLPRGFTLGERAHAAFLAAGLGPLGRWMPGAEERPGGNRAWARLIARAIRPRHGVDDSRKRRSAAETAESDDG